jgi:fructoselysine-6-P-deglycase FrlB-like protein
MTRDLETPQTTLRLMREARKNCAKVVVLEPRATAPAKRHEAARILPFTKSRSGG